MPQTINAADGKGISSRNAGAFHVIFADGRVWLLSDKVPFETLKKFFTIADAEKHDREKLLGPFALLEDQDDDQAETGREPNADAISLTRMSIRGTPIPARCNRFDPRTRTAAPHLLNNFPIKQFGAVVLSRRQGHDVDSCGRLVHGGVLLGLVGQLVCS